MLGEVYLCVPAAERYPCQACFPDVPARPYGLAVVDDRGRVADRVIVRALGWTDTTRLDLRVNAGRLLVTAVPDGSYGLAGRDRLALPVRLRRGDSSALGVEPPASLR